jgi:hypothetical protein
LGGRLTWLPFKRESLTQYTARYWKNRDYLKGASQETMGTYNRLHVLLTCPRCQVTSEAEVALYFGDTSQMQEIRLGERYPWVPRKQPQNGGRPEGGNWDGEGYLECEHCHGDSFWRAIVREDVLLRVEPDFEKPGYVPDEAILLP